VRGEPSVDVGLDTAVCQRLLAHVVGERATAAGLGRDYHLDAMAGQEPDGRVVDLRCQHLLRTAGEQCYPSPACAFSPVHLRLCGGRRRLRPALGRQLKHRPHSALEQRNRRPADSGTEQRQAKQPRSRQDHGQHIAHQPLDQRSLIGSLDVHPRMIDEVHVVHVGRTGGHAGEAGEAAIDVLDRLRIGRPAFLEHALDEVNAAARAIELVAEQHIGRAGGGAEAAMHAGPEDLLGLANIGILELRRAEGRFHGRSRKLIRLALLALRA
jgi:hypothetical protein